MPKKNNEGIVTNKKRTAALFFTEPEPADTLNASYGGDLLPLLPNDHFLI